MFVAGPLLINIVFINYNMFQSTRYDWAAQLIYFAVGPGTLTAILFPQNDV